jgi:hypothetical protein
MGREGYEKEAKNGTQCENERDAQTHDCSVLVVWGKIRRKERMRTPPAFTFARFRVFTCRAAQQTRDFLDIQAGGCS